MALMTGGLRRSTNWRGAIPVRARATRDRPRPGGHARRWRVAAALAGAALCGLLALAGPGSIEIVQRAPVNGSSLDSLTPTWSRACYRRVPKLGHRRLAFCARFDGRVIYSKVESGETHLLLVGGLHILIVELPEGKRGPGWGSRIVAVGPLLRARNGQRELRALWVGTS
jgi:hypothetical protein